MARRLRQLWRQHTLPLTMGATAALALGCYGYVLGLPFFFDDLPIMTFLSGRSWTEIWLGPPENPFYRPLVFTVYKLGRLLPPGPDRIALHAVNLALHWLSACLMVWLLRLTGRSSEEALLAAALFVVFPFKFMAVSWVTAMPHLMVTALTLFAVVTALQAGDAGAPAWWALSLLATALAPMAHESGYVCGGLVAAALVLNHGMGGRRTPLVAVGILLNVAALLWRRFIPGAGQASFNGLQDWLGNSMFSLHGLVYPIAPLIGTLVRRFAIQDFLLVVMGAVGLAALLAVAILRRGEWRWMALSLCWWAGGMLPAVVSLRYGYNYTAPRVYSLASPGITMLWAGVLVFLSGLRKPSQNRAKRYGRWVWPAISVLLGGAILLQNVAFLSKQRELFTELNRVYRRVFDVASPDRALEPGFVNLPTSLARPEKTYAMILETVLFLPPYSSFAEFMAVNGARPADVVVYSPVVQDPGYACGLRGEGLDWEGMRQFAVEHEGVWLARWRDGDLVLDHVGHIQEQGPRTSREPVAVFADGVAVESAAAQAVGRHEWKLSIEWVASAPLDGRIFVHVRDGEGNLVTQVDGPALGGMVPSWIWQPGDHIHDVRYVTLGDRLQPYTVEVGLFDTEGRLPAYSGEQRCPDDVCPVATIVP